VTRNIEVVPLLVGQDLTALLANPGEISRPAAVRELADSLRNDLVDLCDELLFRVGGVRSRRALIDRYVARCERYGRERLRDLAQRNTGKAEALLRDDLALYLFDNGLDPLTETALITTRSDLLELSASPVLVEAKQYTSGAKTTLTGLVQGAYRQTVDTASELGPRRAAEAFIVVYRRGGSRLALPQDPVRLGETNYFFRLVDLAEANQTGSSAAEAVIELTAEQITEAVLHDPEAQTER
jgi:hypothetical protein